MKIAIVYESVTGNTKAVAQAIREAFPEEEIVLFGEPQPVEADLYLVGSWTDKGMCSGGIREYLSSLRGRRIAYFGTAGFGGSPEYYETLFRRVAEAVDDSNQLLGSFYCQGKMPPAVEQRYEKLLQEHPGDARAQASLDNYHRALGHPDVQDLENAQRWAKSMAALKQ